MDEFSVFLKAFQEHFSQLTVNKSFLYETDADKEKLVNLYLDSFPEGTNNIFRSRREYDCSCCKATIKKLGGLVAIKDGKMESVWDFDTQSTTFQPVVDALNTYVLSRKITGVFITPEKRVGTVSNEEHTPNGTIVWTHLYADIPEHCQYTKRGLHETLEERLGEYRTTKEVFMRSLDELTQFSVEAVIELSKQGSIYKGNEWISVLESFLAYKTEYDALETREQKDLYVWSKTPTVGIIVGRLKNHSIGVLLADISEGVDLTDAVRKYLKSIAAPEKYMRSDLKLVTQKQVDAAKKDIVALGLENSLGRRYAVERDLSVNDVIYVDRKIAKDVNGLSALDEAFKKITASGGVNPKNFDHVETITIDKFIHEVLGSSTTTSVEVLMENRFKGNLVSLIAPTDPTAKSLLKWGNNFSWAYNGNLTDEAMIRENVKRAGGNIKAVLRASLQWNEGKNNENDYDLHCMQPNGDEIWFRNKGRVHSTSGMLDIDIVEPSKNCKDGLPAVENITWTDLSKMPDGTYTIFVNLFTDRGGEDGFRVEIETAEGSVHEYDYRDYVPYKGNVVIAEVIKKGDQLTVVSKIPESSVVQKDIWGIETNQFVPVKMITYSPNFWETGNKQGNQHVFFILKGCKNPDSVNGFFNEFLNKELYQYHRKTFEALASAMKVEKSDEQLSGLGFSLSRRNEIVVRVKGATERVLRVTF